MTEPRLKLRVGSKVGRTIYKGDGPDDLIGVMDTRELAAEVVAAFNENRCDYDGHGHAELLATIEAQAQQLAAWKEAAGKYGGARTPRGLIHAGDETARVIASLDEQLAAVQEQLAEKERQAAEAEAENRRLSEASQSIVALLHEERCHDRLRER